MQNSSLTTTLHKIALVIISIALLVFPLVFTSLTTDAFSLPKELLIGIAAAVGIILYTIYMVVERKMVFRLTPFDLPVFLFLVVCIVSAWFAVNQMDSLTATVPVVFAVGIYFAITNIVRKASEVLFVVTASIIGALLSGLVSVLSFFHVYLLPFTSTQVPNFTTFGSLLDQAIYLAIFLPLAIYLALPLWQRQTRSNQANNLLTDKKAGREQRTKAIIFTVISVVLFVAFAETIYQLFTTQKPLLLPFTVGFQTAFAAISQDSQVLKSFLLGSGFGTYMVDFTRFKPAAFNLDATLWSYTFFRSTSFFLEIIATTGFLGALSFLFIVFKVIKQKVFFLPVAVAVIAAFVLPFSPVLFTAFFVIIAIFATLLAVHQPAHFPVLEFHFVALKEGLLSATNIEGSRKESKYNSNRIMPILILVIFLLLSGVIGYYTYLYTLSDVIFNQSLAAASRNDGRATYNLQNQAIQTFKWRDTYYRNFSQTNLAIANALAASQPKTTKPDAAVQQQVLGLIQQSITAGRAAVTLAPQTALDWNNLSSIYRMLIGFGQNADSFSVLTNQYAIALDPNNPQQYINLGGIYYQLGQWDQAIGQFTSAYKAKPDYANAWYNLGHAYESKGDSADALLAYKQVQVYVSNDSASKKKIDAEIAALQEKIANKQTTSATPETTTPTDQLNATTPSGLPERNPKVEIPGPSVSPIPTKTTTPTPTVSPSAAATTETPTPSPTIVP